MRDDDYEDAEEYLEDLEDRIEREYGKPYDELTKQEQREALKHIFFAHAKVSSEDVELLREGLGRPSGESRTSEVIIRGYVHTVERDAKGRFVRWLD